VSFAIVRSGRLDLSLLGAFEVAANGDLANWKIPGKFSPGMGGAIELAQKARRVGVIMMHTDRKGNPKILSRCTLPLTARGHVNRRVAAARACHRLRPDRASCRHRRGLPCPRSGFAEVLDGQD